jgi:lipopolysaccharide export system protein LptA
MSTKIIPTKTINAAFIAALLAGTMSCAAAQSRPSKTSAPASPPPAADAGTSVPNALQGFQQNRNQPVKIEASRLEVRDKDKVATFTGNVKVVQGDTTMHCKVLVVFYEKKDEGQGAPAAQAQANAKPGAPMPAATPGPGGSSQINRLEAKGNVVVTQKDQTATGDTGLFDMKSNTVTMTGNVLVSQGQNVLRGERLVVDLTTGVSRVDAGASNGPVRMLIQQGAQPNAQQQGTPSSNTQQQGAAQPSGSTGSPAKFAPRGIY